MTGEPKTAETAEMIFDRAFLVTTRELNRLHGPQS